MQRIVYTAAFLLAMMLNAVAADPWGGGSGGFSLAYLATQFCSLTGCTMSNTLIFDNVATSLSTTGNNNLVLDPAGAGATVITGDASVTGNFTSNVTISKSTATEVVTNITTGANAGYGGLQAQLSGALAGRVMLCGTSGCTDADQTTRITLIGYAGFMPAVASNTDVAANAVVFDVSDNVTGTAVRLLQVYGSGGVRTAQHTSAIGVTCASGVEGLSYDRVIAASNKSGTCKCVQTSSGVYGWKVVYTLSSTPLADGDC